MVLGVSKDMGKVGSGSGSGNVRSSRFHEPLVALAVEKVHMKRKWWCNIFAGIFSALVVVPLTYLVYFQLDRTPSFTLTEGKIVPSVVEQGAEYHTQWTLNIRKPCRATVYQTITDSENVVFRTEVRDSVFSQTDYKHPVVTRSRPRIMPSVVSPGKVKVETHTRFYCNWLQYSWPLTRTWDPVYVEVTKRNN